jgi:hypothetical protein
MSSMVAPPLEELLPDLSHLFFLFFLSTSAGYYATLQTTI